jgi:hypothetical protein
MKKRIFVDLIYDFLKFLCDSFHYTINKCIIYILFKFNNHFLSRISYIILDVLKECNNDITMFLKCRLIIYLFNI